MKTKIFLSVLIALLGAGALEGVLFHVKCYNAAFDPDSRRLFGGDFNVFYVAGQMAIEDPASVYRVGDLQQRQQELVRSLDDSHQLKQVYAFPPFFTPLFSFLSRFDYMTAAVVWLTFNLACVGASLVLVAQHLKMSNRSVLLSSLAIFGFPPFFTDCLGLGQIGGVLLLLMSSLFVAISCNRPRIAGGIFALGSIKPPVFVGFGVALLLARSPKFLFSFAMALFILIALSMALLGDHGLNGIADIWFNYRPGGVLPDGRSFVHYNGVGLLGLVVSITHNLAPTQWFIFSALSLAAGVPLCILVSRLMNRQISAVHAFIAIIPLSTVLALHVMTYDLAILLLPLWLLLHLDNSSADRGWPIILAIGLLFIPMFPLPNSGGADPISWRATALTIWTVLATAYVLRVESVRVRTSKPIISV